MLNVRFPEERVHGAGIHPRGRRLHARRVPEGQAARRGPYALRCHSIYPWHKEGAYEHLTNEQDRETMTWVRAFNRYDLYSKGDARPNVQELKPYYMNLIDE